MTRLLRKILIVEDEKAIADIVAFNLQREGYDVETAYDGDTGLRMALGGELDMLLLDVMLPGLDGFEVCRRVREKSDLPIIMLTAREEETDKIFGLELGADDYITKPFSMRELLARIHANLRRNQKPISAGAEPDIRSGELAVYYDAHEVRRRGEPVDLTAREFDLLKFMAAASERVFTREELLEKVWGYEYYGDLRTVDVAIRRLREKLEDKPAQPCYILTRRGVGYMFAKKR